MQETGLADYKRKSPKIFLKRSLLLCIVLLVLLSTRGASFGTTEEAAGIPVAVNPAITGLSTPAPRFPAGLKYDNLPGFGLRRWPGSGQAPSNIICIQVESLNCGLEDLQHNGRYLMPFLHNLKQQSLYYPYCFSYHEPGGSSDCEFSIFNNQEPTEEACMRTWQYPHTNSFIKLMPGFGYTPIALHNYHKEFMNRESAYPFIGFERFLDFYAMNLPPPLWVSRDRDLFEYVLAHAADWGMPFFLYVITLTSHKSFGHIVNYHQTPFLADVENTRDRNALTCFNYVDLQLEWFVNSLRANFPDSYLFIYGDHSLATVDYAGHLVRSAFRDDNGILEFVPLFILTPDNRTGIFNHTMASFLDIGPTILSLMPGPAGDAECISYKAYGGSLFYDDVNSMPIPFSGKVYPRPELLKQIKHTLLPYRERVFPQSVE